MDYLILIVVTLVIGLASTGLVRHAMNKYSTVPSSRQITGAQAASQMLRYNGVYDVALNRGGADDDFFDPKSNAVTLSSRSFSKTSVTAIAIAYHEVGHACQHAQGYVPLKFRSAIYPVVNFASNAWFYLLIIGVFLGLSGMILLGVFMYAFVVLFELATLPVEFNASRRALQYMQSIALPKEEIAMARKVLIACALTYVAAALTSVLQLLWLLSRHNDQ